MALIYNDGGGLKEGGMHRRCGFVGGSVSLWGWYGKAFCYVLLLLVNKEAALACDRQSRARREN